MSTTDDRPDPPGLGEKHIAALRETGQLEGSNAAFDLLILHTVGAKSGEERENPMAYRKSEDEDEIFVFASNKGRKKGPGWYYNVLAHPGRVEVEIYGVPKFRAKVRELAGAERDEVYEKQASEFENFREYETATTRVIPVLGLSPVDPDVKL